MAEEGTASRWVPGGGPRACGGTWRGLPPWAAGFRPPRPWRAAVSSSLLLPRLGGLPRTAGPPAGRSQGCPRGCLQGWEEVPVVGALQAPPLSLSQRKRGVCVEGGGQGEPWCCPPVTVSPPGLVPDLSTSKLPHPWGLPAGDCPATQRGSWVSEVPFHSSLSPQPVPGEMSQKAGH